DVAGSGRNYPLENREHRGVRQGRGRLMIWAVSGVTFLAIVFVVLALVYAFSTGTLPVTERLGRLWRPAVSKQDIGFREKQKENVQRVLTDVGKLIPGSAKQ